MARSATNAFPIAARPAGRLFLESALREKSAAALIRDFQSAVAAEGVTRHFCARRHPGGAVELLSCDYPFDPGEVAELGRLRFVMNDQAGTEVSVTMAGFAPNVSTAKRARLHGLATLYGICLPTLLDAGEPGDYGAVLTEAERNILMRLLLGESELDISLTTGAPVRSVSALVCSAAAKLGAEGPRATIVVAAQRGLLNPQT